MSLSAVPHELAAAALAATDPSGKTHNRPGIPRSWMVRETDSPAVEALARQVGIPSLLAQLLLARRPVAFSIPASTISSTLMP